MSETATIILPLPPSVLSPNRPPCSRGGRMARAAAAKKYKRLAKEAAQAEGISTGPWAIATIQAAFFHKQKRRRDDVNHLSMLKPAYDGLVAAGLLADDDSEHLTTLPATFGVDNACSRVVLTVTRESVVDLAKRVVEHTHRQIASNIETTGNPFFGPEID